MSKKNEIPADVISAMDQMQQHTENTAQLVTAYYQVIIREVRDPILVGNLTLDFNRILWEKYFGMMFKGKVDEDG